MKNKIIELNKLILDKAVKEQKKVNVCIKGRWHTGKIIKQSLFYELVLSDRVIPFLEEHITRPIEVVK